MPSGLTSLAEKIASLESLVLECGSKLENLEEAERAEPWEPSEIKKRLEQEKARIKMLSKRQRQQPQKYAEAAVHLDKLDEVVSVTAKSPIRKGHHELQAAIEQLKAVKDAFAESSDERDNERDLMTWLFFRDEIADIERRLDRLEDSALFGEGVQHEMRVRDLALLKAGKPLDDPEIDRPVQKLLELAGLTQILPDRGDRMLTKRHSMDGEERSDVPRGQISRVKQRGFMRDENVLLKAQVVLSRGRETGARDDSGVWIAKH